MADGSAGFIVGIGCSATLGIGAAIFIGAGVAWAETSSPDSTGVAGARPGAVASTVHAGRPAVQRNRGASKQQRPRGAATQRSAHSSRSVTPPPVPGAVIRADQPTAPEPQPALVLNGYGVVATSPLNVTSFYGMYSTAPSTAGSVQGRQQFDLVDQKTGDTVGSFSALVSQNNSFGLLGHRKRHVELLVTDVLTGTAGTEPGEVPPQFSRIGGGTNRRGTFGSVYSAMPDSGGAIVRWTVLTPFGNIPLPRFYDATKGFADGGYINEPFDLGNGYSIGPADPENPWLTTAIGGLSPFYTVEQGTQEFRVYDTATGVTTGTFKGFATPTRDAMGVHTLAILVTDTEASTNVGTAAGQVPPVDSVFLLYYANPRTYLRYSSLPSESGDVIATELVRPRFSLRLPLTFNASAPPDPMRLQVPGGYTLVPTSPLYPSGLNGLPPLEVLYQGYQQFDVVDPAGNKIGSVEADVSHQWNGGEPRALLSNQNTGILITRVTAGTPGTGPGDVPPPGSVFNFLQSHLPGVGRFNSALPSPTGNVTTNLLLTPFGALRVPHHYDAAAGLIDVTYVDPFARAGRG